MSEDQAPQPVVKIVLELKIAPSDQALAHAAYALMAGAAGCQDPEVAKALHVAAREAEELSIVLTSARVVDTAERLTKIRVWRPEGDDEAGSA